LATGRGVRIPVMVDAFIPEYLTLEKVDMDLSTQRVTNALEQVIEPRGMAESIRCNNGPN
jgi:hypothetical protein